MKYQMLSKEQFEELADEFARFLASQEIDATEWKDIKLNRSHVAQQEMEIFSDLVWDGALEKSKFLEHMSPNSLNLFKVDGEDFHRILLKVNRDDFDLFREENYKWLMDNLNSKEVEIFKASKKFSEDYKMELFELIQKGAQLSSGLVYDAISDFV
ncbi:DUF6495 family protein [Flavobacteriaceae bacterium]|nr:DUF6495 family protein [Flavobacteriaceae bacterium]